MEKTTLAICYFKHISREDARNNPDAIFIFGDNDERTGLGGLAKELRGEPNAFGIRVKKKPYRDNDAYYSDNEYNNNLDKITEDINRIIDFVNDKIYRQDDIVIIYPKAGIGTGLADMERRCPETFNAMNLILEGTLKINNGGYMNEIQTNICE